ncbi:MAG: LamG domain-containing protein, partial [Symploca sp. SIO3E6]|nr:LamG domain-containing protein [Caldora sp. SIO3E6]
PELNPAKFTLSCWAKVEGSQGKWRSPVTCRTDGPQGGYILYAGTNNKWQFWTGNGQSWVGVTGSDVVLNTWTHLAATYDGSTMTLYINGEPVGTPGQSKINLNTSHPLRIGAGRTEGNPIYFFNGDITEVRLWDQARSQAEIKQSMNQRLQGDEAGLVGYWPLNEGSGNTAEDKTSNENPGTLHGVTWKQEALDFVEPAATKEKEEPTPAREEPAEPSSNLSPAITFDGKKDYVEIPPDSVLDLTDDFTIEAWIKPEILGKRIVDKGIGGKSEGFTFDTHPQNLRFINKGIKFTSRNQLKTGTWQHVAATFKHEADGAKLYINGEEENTATPNQVGSVTKLPVRLASQADALGNLFKGEIAEVRLWNRVRSQDEIKQSMNHRLRGDEAGLVGYWPLNEGSGTTIADQTSNNNPGTLHEGTWKQEALDFIQPASPKEETTTEPESTTTETEPTTTEPEPTTTEPESTTTEPESTTTEPESTTTEPESTTTEPESTTTETESTTTEPESTTTETESTTTETEPTTTEPESTTTETEQTTTEPEPTTAETESTTTELEPTIANQEKLSSVLTFDGKDDFIDCGSGINLTNTSFTIEFWAKRQTTGKWHMIVFQGEQQKYQGLHIGFRHSDVFTLAFYADDLNTGKYTDSDWHHWSCVYNHERQQQIIYCDGQLEACRQPANYQGTGNFYIGALKGTSAFFEGQLADIRIWQGVRTPQEIQDAMNYRLSGNESGLLAYWPLDEGEGTTIKDKTGNGHDGAIAGAVWEKMEIPFEDTESPSNMPIVITVNGEKQYLDIPSYSTLNLIDDYYIRFKWGVAKIEKDDIKIKMKIRRS